MSQLILLGLPIGNLGDLTMRVKEALEKNDGLFVAEDTRNLRKILSHLGMESKEREIITFHDHDRSALNKIVSQLKSGRKVYLLSDAGSPIVSDPAYPLVKEVISQGIEVTSFPAVSSSIMALELSGLAPAPHIFHGFIGRDDRKRKESFAMMKELSIDGMTHIYFESPHRVEKTLSDLANFSSEHQLDVDVSFCRELTKKFESVVRFKAIDFKNIKDSLKVKGECVLVFYIHPQKSHGMLRGQEDIKRLAHEILEKGQKPKSIAKLVAKILGMKTDQVYQELVK